MVLKSELPFGACQFEIVIVGSKEVGSAQNQDKKKWKSKFNKQVLIHQSDLPIAKVKKFLSGTQAFVVKDCF